MCRQEERRWPRAWTVLCTVGWLLPLALGCRLTEPDEVDRRPNVVRGGGGRDSGGHGAGGQEDPDGRADAPALPDAALPSDQFDAAVDNADATIDGGAACVDTIAAANPIPRRTEESEASRGDLDRHARSP